MTTAAVAKSMEWEFSLYSTYGWHPLSVEAAIATIRYMVKHKRQLLDNVAEIGAYFLERLSRMKFKSPAKIRAKGLAIGIAFGTRNYASELLRKCRSNGLLLSELDDKTLTLFPPLTINRKIAKRGLDILEQCL